MMDDLLEGHYITRGYHDDLGRSLRFPLSVTIVAEFSAIGAVSD
jgi:hypothetical protein